MAEKISSSKTLVWRKCEAFQVTEDPETERKKTPTSATTQNKNGWVNKRRGFLFVVHWRYKMEKLSQYMIASQSLLSTKKKSTRWQRKKKCAEEEKLEESRDSNRLWTNQMNSSRKCFSFSFSSGWLFCFRWKTMEKAVSCVLNCLFFKREWRE